MRDPKEPWTAHRDSDVRRASAIALAIAILAAGDELTEAHRREALSLAIWKYTEADGKFKTRYRSKEAVGAAPSELNHEHVVTRKSLIAEMIQTPDRVAEILGKSIACCVLRTEHQRLAEVERTNPSLIGWERYRAADIEVVDLATGDSVI